MRGRDRRDGIGEHRRRRIRHHRVIGERDQNDGEMPAHVLRPSGERPQPATDRALRQAQQGGDPAVPHAQRGYLQPGPDHLGRIRPPRPEHFRQQHVRDAAA